MSYHNAPARVVQGAMPAWPPTPTGGGGGAHTTSPHAPHEKCDQATGILFFEATPQDQRMSDQNARNGVSG